MTTFKDKEIIEAIEAADKVLYLLNKALEKLSSASNWGIADVLGGGFLTTSIKHNKIDDAKYFIEQAKEEIQNFGKELSDLDRTTGLNFQIGEFLTMADFWGGGFFDWFVQEKINDGIYQVNQAIFQTEKIKKELINMRKDYE